LLRIAQQKLTAISVIRLQGYVHDMGAAMEGGIGGHAGIFFK
jgi:hypothetical protein